MIFSALSSSSDARMRFSRSLCGAGFLAGAAAFLGAGFLTGLLAVFRTVFGPVFGEGPFGRGLLGGRLGLGFLRGLAGRLFRGFQGYSSFAVRGSGLPWPRRRHQGPAGAARSNLPNCAGRPAPPATAPGPGAAPPQAAGPAAHERRQHRTRPPHHHDGNDARDLLPALPARELFQIVAAHQPDEARVREAALERLDRVYGVAGAQPLFDIGDADEGMARGGNAGARKPHPNAPGSGLSGFPGDTSHQT